MSLQEFSKIDQGAMHYISQLASPFLCLLVVDFHFSSIEIDSETAALDAKVFLLSVALSVVVTLEECSSVGDSISG